MGQAATRPPAPPPSRPDNFFSKEFLTKHVSDIIAFYEPRCVDARHGGFFQNFKIDGTVFDPSARQIVSSSRMTILKSDVHHRPVVLIASPKRVVPSKAMPTY